MNDATTAGADAWPVPELSDPATRRARAANDFYRDHALTGLINTLAGNPANQGWDAARHQLPIMEEEWKELKGGIEEGDAAKVRDGAADLLFTLIGFCHRAGIDLLGDYAEVVKSNFTKIDHSGHDALLTRNKYLKLGVNTINRMVEVDGRMYWVTLTDGEQTDHNGRVYPAGKWLKSVHFQDVNFHELPEDNLLTIPTHPVGAAAAALEANAATPVTSTAEALSIALTEKSFGEPPAGIPGVILPQTADNDPDIQSPVEPAYAASHAALLENLPCKLAVDELVSMLHTDPIVGRAMEEFLSFIAFKELIGDALDHAPEGPAQAIDRDKLSAAAVTGAQRFLTYLLLPTNYTGALHPCCYVAITGSDERFSFDQLTRVLHSALPADRAVLLRAIQQIALSLSEDEGFAVSWHANLVVAWLDSKVKRPVAERIARQVFRQLFELESPALSLAAATV